MTAKFLLAVVSSLLHDAFNAFWILNFRLLFGGAVCTYSTPYTPHFPPYLLTVDSASSEALVPTNLRISDG